jgi:septal ring factor EnvC (AmiA/AmiB activator)
MNICQPFSSSLQRSFFKKWFFVLTIGFLVPFMALSQTKKELEKKKDQIQKDIDYTNQLLNLTKKSKNTSLSHLVTLNKKISYRNDLINTISTELNVVDKEIGHVETNIDSLNNRLERLKLEYSQMLYFAYKNQGAYSRIMFIFSSDGINQAYKRMLYLHQLSDYRIYQRDLIVELQDSLNGKKTKLQDVRQDKKVLLITQEKQKFQLDSEKKDQVNLLNNLSTKEKKLRAELKEKQRKQQQLSNKIEEIIKKEIEAARKSAKKKDASTMTASKSTKPLENTNTSVLLNTPATIKLSNDFENNKGLLPWPVEKGIISSSFGKHAHPVWRDVVINNNGVDINSTKGAKARAIFEGRVVYIVQVYDKYAVLVQHGEYFTLYSNLEKVFVKAEDKVITKQPLGIVQTNDEEGKTEIHLEIWKGSNKMNPEAWIASR